MSIVSRQSRLSNWSRPPSKASYLAEWESPVSATCQPRGRGSISCSGFLRSSSGFEPGLCRQRAPPPGNGISVARDKSAEMASQIQLLVCRDQAPAACAANSGPFAVRREISLNAGVRGGHHRDRTCDPYYVKVVDKLFLAIYGKEL
jgi:hypothetical protein